MNQILFEINEIPLVYNPETIVQNKIANITGFYKDIQTNKEYKYINLEFNKQGFYSNFEKYNDQGKLICKRDFDVQGRLIREKHFIGNEELEYHYDMDYKSDRIIKTMKDPQNNVLGRTIIVINGTNKQYKASNFNNADEIISEFEYSYKNESGLPDITSKTRGEYYFKEEGDTIVLIDNFPSAPKSNPNVVYSRDSKSMQIKQIDKEDTYKIRFLINTY